MIDLRININYYPIIMTSRFTVGIYESSEMGQVIIAVNLRNVKCFRKICVLKISNYQCPKGLAKGLRPV